MGMIQVTSPALCTLPVIVLLAYCWIIVEYLVVVFSFRKLKNVRIETMSLSFIIDFISNIWLHASYIVFNKYVPVK